MDIQKSNGLTEIIREKERASNFFNCFCWSCMLSSFSVKFVPIVSRKKLLHYMIRFFDRTSNHNFFVRYLFTFCHL